MNIGIIRGIKFLETRVALVPRDVKKLVDDGHTVLVENGAGIISGHDDSEYESIGAEIMPTSEKVYKAANLICKIQNPMPVEFESFVPEHICISHLNLADNRELLEALLKTGATFIASEMIGNLHSGFPIFDAMNEISGKLAVIEAGKHLQQQYGGKGILLMGTEQTPPARLVILGSGISACTAAVWALRNSAQVTMLDDNYDSLQRFQQELKNDNLTIHEYSPLILREVLLETDVLIAAKHAAGFKSPLLMNKTDLKLMQPGSLVIDLAIDQGGCLETSRPTTPGKPIFVHDKIIHFCVSPLPAAVPATASSVYSAQLLPYIKAIAGLGGREALAVNSDLRNGLNIYQGKLVNRDLAACFQLQAYDILELFEMNI